MKFFQTKNVIEVMTLIKENVKAIESEEWISVTESYNRVTSEEIFSIEDAPNFMRSSVDGYAIVASDTFGASDSMPAFLNLIGEVKMGEAPCLNISPGEAVYVPTGGMVPNGANGVVMIEYSEDISSLLNVFKQVAPYENCVRPGDDMKVGERILGKDHLLRPQDISALASLGISRIKVRKKIRVGYLSTGDEIVSHLVEQLPVGKIRDSNVFAVQGICQALNCDFIYGGIVKDKKEDLLLACTQLLSQVDMLVLSGGSSVGAKDYSVEVLGSLGEPGIYVHGIAVKPGKPTIIGQAAQKPVLGLPGHPVSSMVIFKLIGTEIIRCLMGIEQTTDVYVIEAKISQNIASHTGRTDYLRVSLKNENGEWLATPVYGKSAIISTLVQSDGLAEIPANVEGISKGDRVKVILLS